MGYTSLFDDKRERSYKLIDFNFVFVFVVLYGQVTKSTPRRANL